MKYLTYFGRTTGSGILVCLLCSIGCGGAMEGDDSPITAGSAATASGGTVGSSVGAGGVSTAPRTVAQGAAGSVASTVAAPICYGVVDTTPATYQACYTFAIGPLEPGSCVFNVPLNEGTRLNPAYLRIYFDDSFGRLEVPFVGAAASCPTTGTAGGWYSTNTNGGTTDIGFCGCTCVAAQQQEVTLSIDCAGVG